MLPRLIVLVALVLLSGCSNATDRAKDPAAQAKSRSTFDIDRCYPYVVTKDYLPFQPDDGKGLVRPFGHGLFVLLVQDLNGLVQNVTPDDLAASKLTADTAHDKALENLQKLFASGEIKAMKYDEGPHNRPFILVGDHWAAAACILLPKVRSFAQKNLGQDEILASIPHRDVMLLFPKPSKGALDEFRKFVVEHESEGRKPLTFELFELKEKDHSQS